MSFLWVPPSALVDGRREHEAELREMAVAGEWGDRKRLIDEFNQELRRIDDHLELVWFDERATAPGISPGRWHVIRWNGEAPPQVIVHEGPHGEYIDPDSSLFRRLEAGDMWDSRVVKDRRNRELAAERARKRREELETADRRQEMVERLQAVTRTQVSMTEREGGWTQNAVARKERKKAA